ncbi:hypothetical protein BJ322DRAFT_1112714 [Thelephora terrestris]|uniref:Uncharacterized protein n=1 Tax=Thelephora terrestris TaxID=56493 RepID=A0A9P6L2Z4_9AGAM|nr:hypothetical protein BJ322DRAFT_1112714 [Thelephora terrestris]
MTSPSERQNLSNLDEIEARLATIRVEPGISYFNARRELWLNGKKKVPRPGEPPASITRLEAMVRDPRALRSNTVWEAGLGRISKRLIDGGRLKYNLPMHLLIKILYAGWIRDGTWPPDAQAPESDGFLAQAQ